MVSGALVMGWPMAKKRAIIGRSRFPAFAAAASLCVPTGTLNVTRRSHDSRVNHLSSQRSLASKRAQQTQILCPESSYWIHTKRRTVWNNKTTSLSSKKRGKIQHGGDTRLPSVYSIAARGVRRRGEPHAAGAGSAGRVRAAAREPEQRASLSLSFISLPSLHPQCKQTLLYNYSR